MQKKFLPQRKIYISLYIFVVFFFMKKISCWWQLECFPFKLEWLILNWLGEKHVTVRLHAIDRFTDHGLVILQKKKNKDSEKSYYSKNTSNKIIS